MMQPTLRVSDAGQAYEAVDRNIIRTSLKGIFDCSRKSMRQPDPCISVLRSRQSCVTYGGYIHDRTGDRDTIFLSKLEQCVYSLLSLNLFRVGNRVLKQCKGIPIGGPISGAILRAVLATIEYFFLTSQDGITLQNIGASRDLGIAG